MLNVEKATTETNQDFRI